MPADDIIDIMNEILGDQLQEKLTEENQEALDMGWQQQPEDGPDEEEDAYR
jgi:hypothetical protein